MNTVRSIWIAACALAVAPLPRAPAGIGDWEFDPSQISQAGQEIIDRVAPEGFKEQYRFFTPQEIVAYIAPIQQTLAGDSVEALAAIEPQARQALQLLRAYPQTESYADWLEARMDFLEMAAEVARAIPAPAAPAPTPPTTVPTTPTRPTAPAPTAPTRPTTPAPTTATTKPAPTAPTKPSPAPTTTTSTKPPVITPKPTAAPPANVEKARNRYVENKQVWLRKLANRPVPSRAAALLPDVRRAFSAEGVPPQLVWQAEAESSFNPEARSPVGAAGLYQFMPATAQQFGLRLSPEDERLIAIKSAHAAAKYLKQLHARFGSWPLAFAAYNCGEGRVSKTLRNTGGKTFDDIHDQLPAETRMYVPKIAALVQLRENADIDKL